MMKPLADYSHFDALDIRVGRIIKVEDAATKKPTYRLTIDFGTEIGIKVSCGAYRNYAPDQLLGKQIIGVVNFAEKNGARGFTGSSPRRAERKRRDDLSDAPN
jgi:tRNA-binding protein